MSAAAETWENVYSGTDARLGETTTSWVIQAMMPLLPEPIISPTCARLGHDWSEERKPISSSRVRACVRCARRGLLVLQTVSEASR